jgi:hypothetical protein
MEGVVGVQYVWLADQWTERAREMVCGFDAERMRRASY